MEKLKDSQHLNDYLLFVGSGVWLHKKVQAPKSIPYISFGNEGQDSNRPGLEGFIRFWTFIIIYQVSQ